jgi:hypothetical protein
MTMNDNEILDALNWALDAMDEGRLDDARDYVAQVRDEYDSRQDAANEAVLNATYSDYDHEAHVKKHLDAIDATRFADARDQHLINQNFNRAFGVKK